MDPQNLSSRQHSSTNSTSEYDGLPLKTDLTSNSMLEDESIAHLISWSPSEDSFLMSPSSDFSKVLAYVTPQPLSEYV